MQRKISSKEKVIIAGCGELFELLRELKNKNKLKLNILTFISDLHVLRDNCLSVIYVGGFEKKQLKDLKEKSNYVVNMSLSYYDRLVCNDLSIPNDDFTKYIKIKNGIYYPVIKRLCDIFVSLFGLIISLPIMLIVSLLVRIKLGSPVVFSQARPGKYEKVFKVYKFRSMTNATDANGELLPDNKRITKFGLLLRSTSLDELPQLFSILKGHMSLIGPRPQSFENVYFMNAKERMRHVVTPGLTGYSQVNGRNAIPWDEKIQYDLDYIKHGITFYGDMKIFFKTIKKVIFRNDITQEGSVSTESVGEFKLRTKQITEKQYLEKHYESKSWIEDMVDSTCKSYMK